jgi:hypothetical protein
MEEIQNPVFMGKWLANQVKSQYGIEAASVLISFLIYESKDW